jgi:hypothetical protein
MEFISFYLTFFYKPHPTEAADFAIVEKSDKNGVDADTEVIVSAISQRIRDDDAPAARINGGQRDDTPHCTGLRQFRVVKVLAFTLKHRAHSLSSSRSQNVTVLL